MTASFFRFLSLVLREVADEAELAALQPKEDEAEPDAPSLMQGQTRIKDASYEDLIQDFLRVLQQQDVDARTHLGATMLNIFGIRLSGRSRQSRTYRGLKYIDSTCCGLLLNTKAET